jgi:hypothetical protein
MSILLLSMEFSHYARKLFSMFSHYTALTKLHIQLFAFFNSAFVWEIQQLNTEQSSLCRVPNLTVSFYVAINFVWFYSNISVTSRSVHQLVFYVSGIRFPWGTCIFPLAATSRPAPGISPVSLTNRYRGVLSLWVRRQERDWTTHFYLVTRLGMTLYVLIHFHGYALNYHSL